MAQTFYISDKEHYTRVFERVKTVKKQLWIGTADIKDLHVKQGNSTVSFLKILSDLILKGVEVRLIHAKEPGPNFRKDFDKYHTLINGLERVLCPRVHFKLMIFDLEAAYIGSANLTGAAMGMKSINTRNFEAGILSSEPILVERAINQFDEVWMGRFCTTCKRKTYCGDKIN